MVQGACFEACRLVLCLCWFYIKLSRDWLMKPGRTNDASCEEKLTLIHSIHNETNSHGQHDHAVDLRSRVVVFTRKGQNGNGCTSQDDRHVHPSQEGSEVKGHKRI
jgi:hypothetical protein